MTAKEEALKELEAVAREYYKDERKVADMLRWAAMGEERAKKMTMVLRNDPNAESIAIDYAMSRIVSEERRQ
ncbi:MAG: hypothetical protein K6G03_11900 [Lachnospiraceae bacterium]|nr:hypothetical protein [Lachnospiraceae bacterium]